jgi:hypothetical protein
MKTKEIDQIRKNIREMLVQHKEVFSNKDLLSKLGRKIRENWTIYNMPVKEDPNRYQRFVKEDGEADKKASDLKRLEKIANDAQLSFPPKTKTELNNLLDAVAYYLYAENQQGLLKNRKDVQYSIYKDLIDSVENLGFGNLKDKDKIVKQAILWAQQWTNTWGSTTLNEEYEFDEEDKKAIEKEIIELTEKIIRIANQSRKNVTTIMSNLQLYIYRFFSMFYKMLDRNTLVKVLKKIIISATEKANVKDVITEHIIDAAIFKVEQHFNTTLNERHELQDNKQIIQRELSYIDLGIPEIVNDVFINVNNYARSAVSVDASQIRNILTKTLSQYTETHKPDVRVTITNLTGSLLHNINKQKRSYARPSF